MESDLPTTLAFSTIETELRSFALAEERDEPAHHGLRAEAAMAISDYCRTYRRMRGAIDVALPSVQTDRPDLADLLRFLIRIADRACKVQIVGR